MPLAEHQILIRDTARAFAQERLRPNAATWDREGRLDRPTLEALAELGFGALIVKEEDGGAGLARADAVLIFEELARGCVATAAFLSIHNMCAWMIGAFASAELKARALGKIASMQTIASYCLTEPNAGSDAAALKTTARRDGDHYVLNGAKSFISGGGFSDAYVVMCRTGGEGAPGVSAILVDKGTPGLSFGKNERKMGWRAQPTAQVMLDECRVPAANLIGREGEGFRHAMQGLNGGRLNIAACSLGGAQDALDRALAYAKERVQFGQAIASFQATQFKLADMATDLEAARAIVREAAAALDAGAPNAMSLCAMAKRFATDTGSRIANDALQIHGGYGYLEDYEVERIVRDLRVHQILEGTNEIMRVIIARELLR